ncbi:MAG: hypothetical protein M9921_09695 [Fimbriimonadaceae bacterium]|nr:hypothetical protein [Chthonomonadaceae bacterium]MCO5297117.1 hypothetical protein [Fimbriimonadaceae bacterium]
MVAALVALLITAGQGTPLNTGNAQDLSLTIVRRIDGPKQDTGGGDSEFARFDVSVDLEPAHEGEPKIVWRSMCINACQGPPPNHATHAACNRLCDRPCSESHSFEGDGAGYWRTPIDFLPQGRVDSWRFEYGDVMRASAARGLPWASFAPVLDAVNQFKKAFAKRTVKFERPHIVTPDEPCAYQEYLLYERPYDVVLTVTVTLMSSKGGRPATEAGRLFDHKKIRIAGATLVDPGPTVAPRGLDCACEKTQHASTGSDPPKTMFGSDFKILPTQTRTAGYASLQRESFAKAGRYSIVGESMNAVQVSFSGSDARGLFLPAGTRLVPDDSSAQELVVAENAELLRSTFGVTAISDAEPQRVRVLCAQMKKEAPTAKTRYAVAYPKDPTFRRLAGIAAASRSRGPWDQARLWIYTDDASYDTILDRLDPPITKSSYVRVLHDVLGGSLPEAKANKLRGLLKPEFLAEPIPDDPSANWALRTALAADPKAVVAATRGKVAEWLREPETGARYLATVLWQMIDSESPEAHLAAAAMLLHEVPDSLRDAMGRSPILDLVVTRLFSSDEPEVLSWLDVFARYGIDSAKPWIEVLAASGSGKARDRARELLRQ